MRRCLRLTALLAVANASLALAGPRFPVEAVGHETPLAGEPRLRYVLRQLELTEEQARHAEGLLESLASNEQFSVNLDQIHQLWNELEEAKDANDNARIGAIAKQLKHLSKDESLDDELFSTLKSQLTDRQKQLLTEARERINRHRSGGLRPGDLMHEAYKLNLSDEQRQKMFEAFKAARKRLGPALRPDEQRKMSLLNAYAKDVRAILAPEQRDAFEYRVHVMRPDLIDDGLCVPRSAVKWQDDEPDAKDPED